MQELNAELHAAKALGLVVGREGDASFRLPCILLGCSVDVAHRDASVDAGVVRLKEFYWMVSAIATFVSLLAECYNRFAHLSFSLLTHICGVVAIYLWALACSPASAIDSAHQWMAGGVADGRKPAPTWHCRFGSRYCRRPRCCARCVEVLDEDSPSVRGYRANRAGNSAMYHNINKFKTNRPPVSDRSQYFGPEPPERWDFETQAGFRRIVPALDGMEEGSMVSVYGAAEGTPNNLVHEEGDQSGLTTRGYCIPTVVMDTPSMRKTTRGGTIEPVWYTSLNGTQRRALGAPGVDFSTLIKMHAPPARSTGGRSCWWKSTC